MPSIFSSTGSPASRVVERSWSRCSRLGCGAERRRLLGAAQHADHPPHLGERLATGLLDDLQRLAFLVLVRLEQPAHGRGLHRHHADAVADDVVQLAGDPRALLGDGEACLLLALQLGLLGKPARHVGLAKPLAEREADDPRDREGDQRPEVVARRLGLRVAVREDHGDDLKCRPPGDRLATVRPHPEPDGDAECDQVGGERVVEEPDVGESTGEHHGDGDERGGHRPAAPEEQGDDECDREQDVEPDGPGRAVGVRGPGGDREQARRRPDDEHVDPEAADDRLDPVHETGSLARSR